MQRNDSSKQEYSIVFSEEISYQIRKINMHLKKIIFSCQLKEKEEEEESN